jgi:hypothetical protein
MEDERERRALSAMTDLGFRAAEMRALCGQLAEACARRDIDTSLDLAQALMPYVREFGPLFINVLVASTGRHKEERRPQLVPADYIGLQERTSV